MITWADVVNIAPQLASVPLATQTAILDAVAILCDADTFDDKYDTASKYLAAHLGTLYLGAVKGRVLPVDAEKVGEVSRHYALPTNWRSTIDTTSFGQMYQFILDRTLNAHMPLVC